MWTVTDVIFLGSKITADGDYSHEIKRRLLLGRKVMTNLVSILKSCPPRQSCGFSSSHVWMWKLDYKQRWAPKNWWFWTVVLEKTPLYRRVPYIARRSNQFILKEIIPEYALEAETPILWPPDVKNWLIGKDLDAGKDWRREEKGMTEGEMVGWHHWLDGHEFE